MKNLLLALSVFSCAALHAQFDRYVFSKDNGTYTELTGASVITDSWMPGQAIYLDLENTPVRVFNQMYWVSSSTPMALGFGGFLAAENDTTGVAVDCFLTDLASMDATSSISTILEPGSDPILKVQWKNAHLVSGDADDYINFQIWIFTKSGDVEYHIGPNKVTGDTAYGTGVDGPAFGVFLASETFSEVYGTYFLDGDVASPAVNSSKVFETITGTPSNGTIYRFMNEYRAAGIARQADAATLSAYPNPFNNELSVNAPTAGQVSLKDMLGRTVFEQQVNSGRNILTANKLPAGNYLLHFTGAEGNSFVKKVQKQ